MAAKNITKTDEEWKMFSEYWKIFKEYYTPEDTDEYWEEVIDKVNEFSKKYNNNFSKQLAIALLEELERKCKSDKQR